MRLFSIAFIIASVFSTLALAGGASGVGAVSPKYVQGNSGDSEPALDSFFSGKAIAIASNYVKQRNSLAIEYALQNEKFNSLLESFIKDLFFDATASITKGLIGPTSANVAVSQIKEIDTLNSRIKLAIKVYSRGEEFYESGMTSEIKHKLFEDFLGSFVKSYCPACAVPTTIGKLAASFATAYVYGFFWGA